MKKEVVLDVWPLQDESLEPSQLFPEQRLGFVEIDENSVGVAASGGGSRSHALCAGYFRGLRELGVLDKVVYLSSVSGGSWASSVFTYAKMDDQRLLGKSVRPEQLTIDFIDRNCPGKLALAVKNFLRNPLTLVGGQIGEKRRNWWPRYIGNSILKEFNLKDKVFAVNEGHKAKILKENKDNFFISDHFDHVVCPPTNKKRPFLIINGVMEGPKGYASGWGASLQFTALYSGVPFYAQEKHSFHYPISRNSFAFLPFLAALWNLFFGDEYCVMLQELLNRDLKTNFDFQESSLNTFWENVIDLIRFPFYILRMLHVLILSFLTGINFTDPLQCITGGGFISTHAFGIYKFEKNSSHFGGRSVKAYIKKDKPFFLEDAVGISSAAFGAFGQNFGFDSTVPKLPYLPILSRRDENFGMSFYRGYSKNRELSERAFGDGGNFENTGILPLLQRGVRKIVAFINTATPLLQNKTPFKRGKYRYNGKWCADPQFLCLFGQGQYLNFSGNYLLNQVFRKEDLDDVLLDMLRNRDEFGKGAVTSRKLTLVENKYWRIRGGSEVQIMFVYNDRCSEFNQKLPIETRKAIGLSLTPIEKVLTLIPFKPNLPLVRRNAQSPRFTGVRLPKKMKRRKWYRKASKLTRDARTWLRNYSDFPHFSTVQATFGRVFSLNQGQINLATAHGEYLLSVANKDLVKDFFTN